MFNHSEYIKHFLTINELNDFNYLKIFFPIWFEILKYYKL